MKRLFLLMSMIACLCLSAVCPVVTVDATSTTEAVYTEDQYLATAQAYFETIVSLSESDVDSFLSSEALDEVTAGALQSWKELRGEIGEYAGIKETEVSINDEDVTIEIGAEFTNRDATFTMVLSPDMTVLISASFVKVLTMGEIFEKAALNTLMGMGTVFAVLIFISFIISLFKYIPNIQAMFAKKKDGADQAESAAEEEYVEVQEEELVDDKELVAVIMAAIYASMESEGRAVSKDGLIVRSIRRSRR